MEVPVRRSHTLGSASGKKLQAALGVEASLGKDKTGVKDIGLHSLVQRMKLQEHRP
jgi:hypothetical protein